MTSAVREAIVLALVAMALAVVVYLNALGNPFVYDDLAVVVLNRALGEAWTVAGALELLAFRPLTALSFRLDRAIWGLAPFGFHLTNLLLHVANVALVFRLAWTLLAGREGRSVAAFATAALFAVHPMLSEAVDYVSARSELLCATFFLGAWLGFGRALVGRSALALTAGVACFVLAVAARETAAALPFVLLVWDLVGRERPDDTSQRRLLRIHLPLIAFTVAAGVLRLSVFVGHEGGALDSTGRHLVGQAGVVWQYLRRLVVPTGLSLVHHVPPADALDPRTLVAVLALAALLAAAWLLRRREPVVTIGIAWFLLVLAPSTVIPLRDPMAEHRVYLASVGFFLVVSATGIHVARRFVTAWPRRRTAAALLVAGLLCALGVTTIARNRVWANPVVLWRDAAQKSPASWIARSGYGNALGEAGDCASAIAELEAAWQLHRDPGIATNLGTCLIAERRMADAAAAYRRALEVDPQYVPAHHNLALLALRDGDRARAHRHFLMSIVPDWRRPRWREELIALHESWFGEPVKTLELCYQILRVASETPGVLECIERNLKWLDRSAVKPGGR